MRDWGQGAKDNENLSELGGRQSAPQNPNITHAHDIFNVYIFPLKVACQVISN